MKYIFVVAYICLTHVVMLNYYIVDGLELISQKIALLNRIVKDMRGKYPNSQPPAHTERIQYILCKLKELEYCNKPNFKTIL